MDRIVKRIDWIDALKGLAIILIVLGHVINGNDIVWHVVYGFHVPLFIILAGITYNAEKYSFLKFLKKRFLSLIIPYIIWGVISIIIYSIIGNYFDGDNKVSLINSFCGLIWANGENGLMRWNLPLWFLPTLFVIELISYPIIKLTKDVKKKVLIIIIEICLAYLVYNLDFFTNLPLGFETAVYLLPFFTFGKLLSNFSYDKYFNKKYVTVFSAIFMIVVGIIIILLQKNVDYVDDQYRNYILFLGSATMISFGLILLFRIIGTFNSLILNIGKNTLPILVMHKFPIMFFRNVFPLTKRMYDSNILFGSIIITIITLILCMIAAIFLKKTMPLLFGVKTNFIKKYVN